MTFAVTGSAAGERPEPRFFDDVPGWFYHTDVVLFDWFLSRQARAGQRGDLLEMGAYLGKSAVLMRAYLASGETFTVCDLFDTDPPDERNMREMHGSYATLTRRSFEANFLSFHDELPRIVQAPTSAVPDRVAADSCRFVHVDASHLYEHVHADVRNARTVLADAGLVVMDDYRSSHTPGVACATWQAVLEDGLRPVCLSNHKFYGTWDDPHDLQDRLHGELAERGDFWLQWQEVAGQRLLLVGGRKAALPELPVSRHAPGPEPEPDPDPDPGPDPGPGEPEPEAAAERPAAVPEHAAAAEDAAPAGEPEPPAVKPARAPRRPRSRTRKVAVDLLPPVATRAIVRVKRQWTGR